MFDRFERPITYLRISVTDKCNLRCRYCMPPEGVPLRRHEDLLTLEALAEAARAAVGLGVTKIRLTGGEPLVRRGIINLVRMIASIPGLEHLGMTTNGTLLAPRARELREAGLDSVNVSLDTLNPERYTEITRGGSIEDALAGIRAAGAAGLPVKINMVVLGDSSREEIDAMRDFCASINARLQLINHFDLTRQKGSAVGSGGENAAGSGGENAARSGRAYTFDRPPACAGCNRIRLLADGTLKPCLHSDEEVRLDPARLTESLREAILAKPRLGGSCTNRSMRQIGG
jgi:cyclic pyranopterin phosphate synthase